MSKFTDAVIAAAQSSQKKWGVPASVTMAQFALDIAYQRADERGDAATKTAIAAQKQALRDVTVDPAIDAAATPDALSSVIPAALSA